METIFVCFRCNKEFTNRYDVTQVVNKQGGGIYCNSCLRAMRAEALESEGKNDRKWWGAERVAELNRLNDILTDKPKPTTPKITPELRSFLDQLKNKGEDNDGSTEKGS